MSDITKATYFMLLSTFSLSITGLLSKNLAQLTPVELLSFLRFVVPCLMLFAFLMLTRIRVIPSTMLKPLLIRGFCIAACQWCFLTSLQTLSLVEGIVLFSTGPLFIPLLEKLIFGATIRLSTILGLLFTFCGVILMAGDLSHFQFKSELLFGLLAGVFNSGSQLSLYRASKSTLTPVETNAWTFFIAGIMIFPITLTSGWQSQGDGLWEANSLLDWKVIAFVILLALLTINTQIFRSKAYQLAESGSQLAPLIFTNLLFSAIWQVMFFDDRFTDQQITGIVLIASASMFTTLYAKRIKSKMRGKPLVKSAM
ncbi:MAG: DMT family transporter [Vibrio gallaecicus]